MNENDVLFQKVTQAYSEKNPSAPDRSTRIFFPSMPVSLSGIIHHSIINQLAKFFDSTTLNDLNCQHSKI